MSAKKIPKYKTVFVYEKMFVCVKKFNFSFKNCVNINIMLLKILKKKYFYNISWSGIKFKNPKCRINFNFTSPFLPLHICIVIQIL